MVPIHIPEEEIEINRRPRKRSQLVSIVLGDDLAKSRQLGVYYLFNFADFLALTAIYIPYTFDKP